MKKLALKVRQLKIHPLTLTVILGLLLFLGNAFRTIQAQAEEMTAGGIPYPTYLGTTATDETAPPTSNFCEPEMKDFASKELESFRTFMETNYQNKSSTGSLTAVGLTKYNEMRSELYTAYGKYNPTQGSSLNVTIEQPGKCLQIVLTTLEDARKLFKTHAVRTSGVKKSTALLEKYQQINAELANLFQQFVYMKAYLDTFAGKFPCYPKSGCVKG